MNKQTTKAWQSTVLAIIASMALGACSSEEDALEAESQSRGVVKAEFTISFPQTVSGITRQSEAVVQAQGTPEFRGMDCFQLYSFDETVADITKASGAKGPSTTNHITVMATAATGTSGQMGTNDLEGNAKYHLYNYVEIPIGTQSFMFFGRASAYSTTGIADNFQNGALKEDMSGTTLKTFRFGPQSIVSEDAVNANGNLVARYMTKIAQSTGWSDTKVVSLQTLYQRFTSINTGAWVNVKQAVQQLYTSLNTWKTQTPGDSGKDVADAVLSAITNTMTTDEGSTKYVSSTTGGTLTFISIGDETLGEYPADMGLPDGAAQVTFSVTDKTFSAVTNTTNAGINVPKLTNYAYPVSLCYRALSPIYVFNEKVKTYNTTDNWAKILEGYKKDNGSYDQKVTKDTRSIAMVDQAQYAVGRLDVKVKATDLSLATFTENETVSATSTNIQLTGVLVGGQRPVNYLFQPVEGTDEYTLYDKTINGDPIYLTTTEFANQPKTYTLVLETPVATKTEDAIKVALEFKNNTTKTFQCKDGAYVYPGCKFYLIGKIDAYTNKATVNSVKIQQAFKQDYYTVAQFEVKSLKSAYGTLPDLRTPELELGMSVDLQWKQGVTHTITID